MLANLRTNCRVLEIVDNGVDPPENESAELLMEF